MKKNVLIVFFFFCFAITAKAQFNTAIFTQKPHHASVSVKPLIKNQFTYGNFAPYHLEGRNEKNRKSQSNKNSNSNYDNNHDDKHVDKNHTEEKRKNPAIDSADMDSQKFEVQSSTLKNENLEVYGKEVKEVIYKRLPTLSEPVELQRVYMPLNTLRVTSPFGVRFHPIDHEYKMHNGIDLSARYEAVFTVLDGVVEEAGYTSANGNYLKIKHGDFETFYLHLDRFYYKAGDRVFAGNLIGISGNTGKSTAPHLHFSVRENGKFIDPIQFLNDLIITNNILIDYENRPFTRR
jgi:murein DD-endopeptidase MepM/ murein hydrolase activator NlpD